MENATDLTVTLIIFLFPLAYSPGPGNLFFAANGARFGFWRTFPAATGYHAATWLVTFGIGWGFGKMAADFPGMLFLIKYLGSAYVFFLAWRLLRAGAVNGDGDVKSKPASFFDGAVLLIFNPKAYLIISAMFTQFGAADAHSQLLLIMWITTVFTLNNWIAFSLWTYAGDRLLRGFRNETRAKRLNAILAMTLAGVAVWMLVN